MQHARLVVLALLAEKDRHGYEVELQVRRRDIRRWAKIGTSTIYKTLKDLRREGHVVGRPGSADRGAGREIFSLTTEGHGALRAHIAQLLASQISVFSDRVVGLVFASQLRLRAVAPALRDALLWVNQSIHELDTMTTDDGPVRSIILDFYTDVMEAERRALRSAEEFLTPPGERSKELGLIEEGTC